MTLPHQDWRRMENHLGSDYKSAHLNYCSKSSVAVPFAVSPWRLVPTSQTTQTIGTRDNSMNSDPCHCPRCATNRCLTKVSHQLQNQTSRSWTLVMVACVGHSLTLRTRLDKSQMNLCKRIRLKVKTPSKLSQRAASMHLAVPGTIGSSASQVRSLLQTQP